MQKRTHAAATPMVDVWRGPMVESVHGGHAVVCDRAGEIVAAWGDPEEVIYPRSSCKMVQALPLVESGALDDTERMALACASHEGAPMHVARVGRWLAALGLTEDALLCGSQPCRDTALRLEMIRDGAPPRAIHNNCSGKHAGFLALGRLMEAGPDYVALDNPVQRAVRAAFEDVTGEASAAVGIDGCSAPNFACTMAGLARAMAAFAAAGGGSDARGRAMVALREAMMAHPELVAGEGRACTDLTRALAGRGAVKTGAEGVFVAILPELGLGVALKIADGATRASEAAIAALLVRLGALDPADPVVAKLTNAPIINRAGIEVGHVALAPGFP